MTDFREQNSSSIFDALDDEEAAKMDDRYNVSKFFRFVFGENGRRST